MISTNCDDLKDNKLNISKESDKLNDQINKQIKLDDQLNSTDSQIDFNNNKFINNISKSTELNSIVNHNLNQINNLNDNLKIANIRKRTNNSIMIDGEVELVIHSGEVDFDDEINENKKEEILSNDNVNVSNTKNSSPKQSKENHSKKSGCSSNCDCNLSCAETTASFDCSTRSSVNKYSVKRKKVHSRSSSSEFNKRSIERRTRSRSSSSEFSRRSIERRTRSRSSSSSEFHKRSIKRRAHSTSSESSNMHSRKFIRSNRSRSSNRKPIKKSNRSRSSNRRSARRSNRSRSTSDERSARRSSRSRSSNRRSARRSNRSRSTSNERSARRSSRSRSSNRRSARRSNRSRSTSDERSIKKQNHFRSSFSSYTNSINNNQRYKRLNRSLSPTSNEKQHINKFQTHKYHYEPNEQIYSFEKSRLSTDLIKGINLLDIYKPNSLQRSILPVLMNKNRSSDVFVKSRPHSGKKTAFLISNIHQLNEKLEKPQLIIVTPTGELVLTIFEYARNIAKYTKIKVQYILRDTDNGGINQQIVIGTIGAILELLRQKSFDKSNIKTCIFDETDILFSSPSNCQKISKIISHFKGIYQLQFYSTFFGDDCLNYVKKYISKKIISLNLVEKDTALLNLFQFAIKCNNKYEKFTALLKVLEYSVFEKMAIFVTGKEEAYCLYRDLDRSGFKQTVCLSSSTPINERLTLIRNFKRGHNIIIINYPLTHGVDLEDVSIVINYDLPSWQTNCNYEYFHRISKCGRDGKKPGFIVNLIDNKSRSLANQIERFYNINFIDFRPI